MATRGVVAWSRVVRFMRVVRIVRIVRWASGARTAVAALIAVAALMPIAALSACGATPVRVEPARLRVIAVPENAGIYVDDRFAGSARLIARRPVAFSPGVRHVTVQADGYFPHDVEVELRPGVTTMRISLRAVPP